MAKGSNAFKETILNYVCALADKDELFATKYANSKKNIDDCVTYILNYVQTSGETGFTDAEIFGQAVHYYEEENINVSKPVNARVVVNHKVELTPEELEKAKAAAKERVYTETASSMKRTTKKVTAQVTQQPSLFD